MSQEALADGKCVVIGLQSTGEARTADVVAERGEELDEFVSGPKVRVAPLSAALSDSRGRAQGLGMCLCFMLLSF